MGQEETNLAIFDKLQEIAKNTSEIKTNLSNVSDIAKDHEKRIRSLEVFKMWLLGAGGLIVFLTSLTGAWQFIKGILK